jgi:hypothetical protein
MKARKGGALLFVLAVLFAITAVATVAVFGTAWWVARNVRVENHSNLRGETTKVETPFGSVQVRERAGLDPKRLGVPVYPGAVREDSDGNRVASFDIDVGSAHKEFSIVAAEYSTPDSPDQVLQFYRRHLPHWIIAKGKRGFPQMEYTEHGYKRVIAIHEDGGRTHIGVASIGEPESN